MRSLLSPWAVYETDLSVRTEIEELPPLPEFPTAARIPELVAQLEELMGCMNPTSYGPTEPRLWHMGTIRPKTWDNCRENSERKSQTHSYHELVDLLIELAMEKRMTPTWTSICEERPLLRRLLQGGRLKPTLTLGRALVGI